MQIRSEQFSALQNLTEAAFAEQLVRWAREHLTDDISHVSSEELLARVRSGIARAQSHGFAWQSSIAKFVALMLRFAPNFDQHPAAAALLARRDLVPEARADLLFTDITAEQWAEIEENYDSYAWAEYTPGPAL